MHLVGVSGASGREPVEDFEAVQRELSLFSAELGAKPQIVAATKVDSLGEPALVDRLQAHVASRGLPFARVSAVTGEGVDALLEAMWKHLAMTAASPTARVDPHETEAVGRGAGARREH